MRGSLTQQLDAARAAKHDAQGYDVDRVVDELAEQRLETPQPGDVMRSDDGQVKYKIEHHANGKHTFHREQPKLSKAEKKAAKRRKKRDLTTWPKVLLGGRD